MKHIVFSQNGKPIRHGALKLVPRGIIFTAINLMLVLTAGCSESKLSAAFDQEVVKKKAQDVIAFLNKQDTNGIRDISTQTLNDALTDDTFAQIYDALGQGGTFVEVTGLAVSGSTNKGTSVDYAVVVAVAKYEKKSFTYTISFDTDMKLAGLYYK